MEQKLICSCGHIVTRCEEFGEGAYVDYHLICDNCGKAYSEEDWALYNKMTDMTERNGWLKAKFNRLNK